MEKMRRILMCVAYDGTNYSGWQVQDNAPTIEGELNKALSALCNEKIEVIGASRTDAGVHSLSSMCVFDTKSTIPADRFSFALRTKLPSDICVRFSKEVSLDFHPRHTLTEKTYEYHIYNEEFLPPMRRLYVFHENRPLNVERMNEAGKVLVGEHDFKSFCAAGAIVETTVREVTDVNVRRENGEVIISVSGHGFLYNMVRIIAGTLLRVGLGDWDRDTLEGILEAKDRRMAGPTLPPEGLLLKSFIFLEDNPI